MFITPFQPVFWTHTKKVTQQRIPPTVAISPPQWLHATDTPSHPTYPQDIVNNNWWIWLKVGGWHELWRPERKRLIFLMLMMLAQNHWNTSRCFCWRTHFIAFEVFCCLFFILIFLEKVLNHNPALFLLHLSNIYSIGVISISYGQLLSGFCQPYIPFPADLFFRCIGILGGYDSNITACLIIRVVYDNVSVLFLVLFSL